jgi:hypothetical protein
MKEGLNSIIPQIHQEKAESSAIFSGRMAFGKVYCWFVNLGNVK